jgi:hypothetical protein
MPHLHRLPANESLLCTFASSYVGQKAGTSIKNGIAALCNWHIKNNAQWNGGLRLSYVLRGATNLTPATSQKRPRPPTTAYMLSVLHNGLCLSEPLDSAVFFIATASFYGQICLGELVPESAPKAIHEHYPSLSNAKSPNAHGSRKYPLPAARQYRSYCCIREPL